MLSEKLKSYYISKAQKGCQESQDTLNGYGIPFELPEVRELSESALKHISPIQSNRPKGKHRGQEPERIVRKKKVIAPFWNV